MKDITPPELTPPVKKAIDHWVNKYPVDQKQSAVMSALMIVQEQMGDGSLTKPLIAAVADYLDMPRIAAYEIATFYSMYEHSPVGRHRIYLCTNISCKLRGSDDLVAHLEQRLGIKLGGTTSDQRFTLKPVECLGACIGAPMCQINKDYYEYLTPEKLDEILDNLE